MATYENETYHKIHKRHCSFDLTNLQNKAP